MTLDAVKSAAVLAAAALGGITDDRLHGHLQLELRAFASMLARERGVDAVTVLGQLLIAGVVAEGFVLTPIERMLELVG